jgi:hypothetical protein
MSESAASIASLARASVSLRPVTHPTNRTSPLFLLLRPFPQTVSTLRGPIGESDFPAQLGEEGPRHGRCRFGPPEGIASIHRRLQHRLPSGWLPAEPTASIRWLGQPLQQQTLCRWWQGERPTGPPWTRVPRSGIWPSGGLRVPVSQPLAHEPLFPEIQPLLPMRPGGTPAFSQRLFLQRLRPRAFQKAGPNEPLLAEPNANGQSMQLSVGNLGRPPAFRP